MIAVSVFLSADIRKEDNTSQWRDDLLRMFFDGISKEGIEEISKNSRNHEFCSGWEGITCRNGEVKEVFYFHCRFGNFNVDTLPPTVTKLIIEKCDQTFRLQTRSLPRELIALSMKGNKIGGRVDLSQLPHNLEMAYLAGNKLKGPIELTNLPRPLKHLYLHDNKIQQQTVYYHNMPKNVEQIRLSGNKIQDICAVDEAMAIENKSIFAGIPAENIH